MLQKREASIPDQHMFNLTLPYATLPITGQLFLGRCWLFASTNVVKYTAAQKLGMADFKLSHVRCWYLWSGIDTVTQRVVTPFLLGQA